MNDRLRTLLEPSSIVAFALVGALAAAGGGLLLGAFHAPLSGSTLTEIPDRFTEVLLDEPWEEGAHATLPAIGAAAPTDDADGALVRKETLERGKLLTALIGTRGESSGTADALGDASIARPAAEAAAPPALRAWFPETLLWAPRVVTDATGRATVEVPLPDQLTTWRVLGLSAAADGSTSGAVLHFDTALDHFVEPLVPPRLRVGDRLDLPVRVGNRGERTLHSRLSVTAEGLSGGGLAEVAVPSGSAFSTSVSLAASAPGTATVHAALGGEDRVARAVEILPQGQPTTHLLSGLLAGTETVPVSLPEGATHARATLLLVPGPVGLLRSEAAAGLRGSTPAHAAAAFRLAVEAPALLEAAGQPPTDAERQALRALRLRAWQGLLGAASTRGPVAQAQVLRALEAAPDDTLAAPVAAHLRATLLSAQAPDGTWTVPDGAGLQRLLATTAYVATVLGDPAATTRAAAVFERFGPQLLAGPGPDPYTPALVLASGAAEPAFADQLRARLRADLAAFDAEAADPTVLAALARPDGSPVQPADLALALAAVGEGGQAALDALSTWTPSEGFGDPLRTQAVLDLLAGLGTPGGGAVHLRVSHGTHSRALVLDPGQPAAARTLVLPLDASGPLLLESEGPAALAWQLRIESWQPWQARPHPAGLALRLSHDRLQVGQPAELRLDLEGPGDGTIVVEVELPAGVQLVEGSLEGARLDSAEEGRLRLYRTANHRALTAIRLRVVPTLAGELWPGAARAWLAGEEERVAVAVPEAWVIAGR